MVVPRFFSLPVVFAIALAGVPSGGSAGAADHVAVSAGTATPPATLDWSRCHGDAECSRLAVPLDDTVVGGPTIDLSLVRYRALDSQRRIGALVVNPGGPGASAIDYVLAVGQSLPEEIRDRFDIVGFDPRGVGESAPVDCIEDLDPLFNAEWAPDTRSDRRELLAETAELVDGCERNNADILPFLQTERTARDLDRIRIALGEPKLTYLGFSYGSYLGAWYAEQFPENVRALVLDGPLDPALDALALQVQQAVGFEKLLDAFLEDCSHRLNCAFRRDGKSAEAYDELRQRIGAESLEVDGFNEPRALNGTQFDLGVTSLLYGGRAAWNELAAALHEAEKGDGEELLYAADLYTGRTSGGSYDNALEAFVAIGCADGPPVGDVASMRAIEKAAAEEAPRVGRGIVNGSLACVFWPVEAQEPRALHGAGAAPILVLGARKDPATPFSWARGLVSELESATLVSVRSSSHTSFDSGNFCVDDLVIRYLVDLEVPATGTRC